MAYERKNNTFGLFKNSYKKEDKHPDYKGEIKINDTIYELSGWVNDGANGKFIGGTLSLPYKKDEGSDKPDTSDEEVPF